MIYFNWVDCMVCKLYHNKAVTCVHIHTHVHTASGGDAAQRGRSGLLEKVVREHLKQKMTFEQRPKEGECKKNK